jgi:hypothetical protein
MRVSGRRALGEMALAAVVVLACPPDAVAQRQARVAEVQASPPTSQVQAGKTTPFIATALDNAGNPIATATFFWASSNVNVATIDQNGIATGLSPGVTIITARSGRGTAAKSAQAILQVLGTGPTVVPQAEPQQIVVPPPPWAAPSAPRSAAAAAAPSRTAAIARQPRGTGDPDALVVRPANVMLVPGERRQLDYRYVRADGENATPQPVVFSLSDTTTGAVRVDSLGLMVAGRETGRVILRASHPANPRLFAEVNVQVRADTVRFAQTAVSLSPGAMDTLRLSVPRQDRDLDLESRVFTFASSDTTKLFVRPQAPILEARSPGTVTVTAEGAYYPYPITVRVSVHRRVAAFVTDRRDSILTLVVGQSLPLSVRAVAADSTPVPDVQFAWALPDTLVARYDTAAKALRAQRPGETRMSVSAPGEGNEAVRRWTIRVVPGGIVLSASRLGLAVGGSTGVTASVLDDQHHPMRALENGTWASSNDSIVRVAGGVISGVRPGRARITARAPWDSTGSVDVFVVGDLVVAGSLGGRWGLYAMQASDPAAVTVLMQDTAYESEPAWSPDLTRLAYVGSPVRRAKTSDLFVMDADGRNARRLTNDSGVVASPSFVPPAGDRIVFESSRGGRSQIYVMGLDGSGRQVLAPGSWSNRSPRVSPDGRKVVFVSSREGGDHIYEMDINGSNARRLTTDSHPESAPSYGPEGRAVYFVRDEGSTTKRLFRVSLESREETSLNAPGARVETYAVSADGSMIALSLSMRALGPEPRFGLVRAASPQFDPLPLARGDQIVSAAFRPARPSAQ